MQTAILEHMKEVEDFCKHHDIDIYDILRFVIECKWASDYELDMVEEKGLFFDCSIDWNTITAWREWEHMVKDFSLDDPVMKITIDICNFMIKYNYQD